MDVIKPMIIMRTLINTTLGHFGPHDSALSNEFHRSKALKWDNQKFLSMWSHEHSKSVMQFNMKLNSIFTHISFIRHVFTQIMENIEKTWMKLCMLSV